MKTQTELEGKRQATDAMIRERPTAIILRRSTREPDGTGGYIETDRDLASQDFVITGNVNQPETTVNLGEIASYGVQLLGYFDADIQDGDTFQLNGGDYQVTFVYPERTYRTIADAIYRGSDNE